ncbi:MAG: hypothetical protein A3F12_04750 [Gammaproteobacteria bacterium RIFCSPHIGHO2_12_FULL_38_14]|nr:MAG: hypothetical protein A3F12_04750 [Gammaproteobacteria bacterium RIFCSPHIGHO2_12_FULL_38_14]
MIWLIFHYYFFTFALISITGLIIFAVGLYFIYKLFLSKPNKILHSFSLKKQPDHHSPPHKAHLTITSNDIKAIAGEDVTATQLDLARAYIEVGKTQLAKKILEFVIHEGSGKTQQEAKQLLQLIN